jgi:hypothetical protein
MAHFNNPLDNVRIATPCNADWDQMIGNERTRFCGQCSLNVYNLSGMTRSEAESLIGNSEGRLCIRYYRRKDGAILTQDCPVGLAAIRRRMSAVARAVSSAVLSFLAGLGVYQLINGLSPRPFQGEVMGAIAIQEPRVTVPPIQIHRERPLMGQQELMGKMARVYKVTQRPRRR